MEISQLYKNQTVRGLSIIKCFFAFFGTRLAAISDSNERASLEEGLFLFII